MTQHRLSEFWSEHPNGRVETTIINCKNGEIIVKAEIYACKEDGKPIATGHSYEGESNGASAVETCEMNAVERALAFAGYQDINGPIKETEAGTEKPAPSEIDPGEFEVKWRDFQGKIKDLAPKRILWLAANYTGKDSEAKKAAKAFLEQHPEILKQVGKTA